jgi:hypothetical protein
MTKPPFSLSEDDVKALYDYFIKRAGYISYEMDLPVIKLIRALNEYLEADE